MGLSKRGQIWHLYKVVKVGEKKVEIRESSGKAVKRDAQEILDRRVREVTDEILYGKKHGWTVADGCRMYLAERKPHQLKDAIYHTDILSRYCADTLMSKVSRYHSTVAWMIEDRLKEGVENSTINHHLKVLQKILNDASKVWKDEDGNSYLNATPVIRLLPVDATEGHPLTLLQENKLFNLLPEYLRDASGLVMNTGLRNSAAARLRWEWEVTIPELGITVFDIPLKFEGERVVGIKNGRPHRVVLNSVAMEIVDRQRGLHPEFVLTRPDDRDRVPFPSSRGLYTTSWKSAIRGAGLRDCRGEGSHFRIHDLKHTFGSRLRAMDVKLEDRKDLLGHTNGDITTHYSAAETESLLNHAEKVVLWKNRKPLMAAVSSVIQRTIGEVV
jgi:integrase